MTFYKGTRVTSQTQTQHKATSSPYSVRKARQRQARDGQVYEGKVKPRPKGKHHKAQRTTLPSSQQCYNATHHRRTLDYLC